MLVLNLNDFTRQNKVDYVLDIHEGQRAVVVVIDDKGSQNNIFLDRAISLMQGVRQVLEVPANGENES
jgi:hypothetical protein